MWLDPLGRRASPADNAFAAVRNVFARPPRDGVLEAPAPQIDPRAPFNARVWV